MADFRYPAYLVFDGGRRLSNWWTDQRRAASCDTPFRRSLTSFLPLIVLAFLTGLLFYARLGCPLLEPEEARYAEIPRQMLAEGRWLVPVLHGEDYLQKPPLLYWLIMVSYVTFGVHDWAARLVPSTSGILVVLITFGWARRTVGARAALASGIILCLSGRFLYLGGMVAMDSLLCLWVLGGLACGHLALVPVGETPRERPGVWWWLLSAFCCGLGILTKGPVAAVLIVGPLVVWKFLDRRGCRVRAGWLAAYGGVTLLASAPWYLAVSLRDPQATGTFFWLHNVVRYLAPFDHEKPAWFYLPGLLLGTLPWSLLLVPLLRDCWRRDTRWARQAAGLGIFLAALVWCLGFFSLSGCKRAGYVLPAFPTLAVVLGTYVTRAFSWRSVGTVGSVGAALVAPALFGAILIWLPEYHRRFGLRAQICPYTDQARDLAVVCYPRRWDSVSFYLGRKVDCFAAEERDQLKANLTGAETLLFVKNDKTFLEAIEALPLDLEFVPVGRDGGNVKVGVVKKRLPKP
jgi:4-amino-4-deoxy-L-arabinose transferase-like glycosyltransferase